jgi:hypothetical protein
MPAPVRKRGFLLHLAAEGIAPVIGGCGQAVERAIDVFGKPIVGRWLEWLRGQPPALQRAAIAELADLPADRSRKEAAEAVAQLAPDAAAEHREVAVSYLAAIPRAAQRALVLDHTTGSLTLPAGQAPADPQTLLRLLPLDAPPYPPGSALPGTPYQLGELLGTGGFGAVYRATAPTLQHLTFALKFCLDRSTVAVLQQERENLERLAEAGRGAWSERIVRLYGYELDHPTPFLVYEYVPGGDLAALLANLRQQTGHGPGPDEAFRLVRQVSEALAFAHERGLVHRDLKPANVLVGGDGIKLADFGIGAAAPGGSSAADQVSLFRGAGTPLYVSPEQRRGEPADPRHDLYSLGVLWYQLLVGDVTRELHPGWARELSARVGTPAEHVALLGKCVGWVEDRPRDASALLVLMKAPAPSSSHHPASTAISPEEIRAAKLRKQALLIDLRELLAAHRAQLEAEKPNWRAAAVGGGICLAVTLAVGLVLGASGVAAGPGLAGTFLALTASLLTWRALVRRGRKALRDAANGRAAEVARRYPDEVQSWGGQQMLLNAELVREIIAAAEADMGGTAPPA